MVKGSTYVKTTRSLMDDQILEFLSKKVNSFIKWDLIRFFHDNPHTKDTAENIARYTGRDARTIERELKALAAAGVLQTEEISGLSIYELVADVEVRETIHRFIEACHDRRFRVEAINHVIREMQFTPHHDF
jgi:DNA-binding transcriptional ArsR family regulator